MTLGGEIVGVVGNVKRRGLSQEVYPEMYASFMQPTFSTLLGRRALDGGSGEP